MPTLKSKVNYSKMMKNMQNSKYGSTTSHTRHSSAVKGLDSMMIIGSLDRSLIGASVDQT